ncbi:MAG: hypothetical protein U0Y10_09370 [Spirosomataceae bacterium]
MNYLKSTFRTLLGAALLGTATLNTYAADPASFKAAVVSTTNSKVNVTIENIGTSSIAVLLKDAYGNVLSTGHVGKKQKQQIIKFDLHEVADGKYYLQITDGKEEITKEVVISTKYTVPERIMSFK